MSRSPELWLVSALAIAMYGCGPKEAKEAEDSVLSDEPATVEGTTSDSDADSGEGGATADVIKVADLSYTLPAGVDEAGHHRPVPVRRRHRTSARRAGTRRELVGGDKSNFGWSSPPLCPAD